MTGAQEPNSTPAMSRAMADLAPDGQAVIIEGAAHMLPMTHREEVNTHLLSFAERCLHDTR
jgi:pimeloyl-ACP methyl ester carboxylesterase